MKRVLYIGGFTMPDGNAAAQRVIGVSKLLRLHNCDVRLCGLSRQIRLGHEDGVFEGFEYRNYPYPISISAWWRYLTGYDYALYEIDSFHPQMVILYNHPALAIERIAEYCNKKRIKVLGDITEWYEPSGNIIFRAVKGADTKRRMTFSHLKLDGLICISSYLTDYYRNRGANVLELPPLVDIQQPKWQQAKEHNSSEVKILYAGSPGTSKDRLDLILKVLDEIVPTLKKPFRFDIIGITKDQYLSTWNDYTEREYVIFNGRRPHEEVIKKLLEADFQIFLRPDNLTNRAGFPTKFVETITSGTLPITNLSSNLSYYLRDSINGFVIPSLEQKSIKETLFRALSLDFQKLEDMKTSINNREFDFHQYAKAYEKFEESL